MIQNIPLNNKWKQTKKRDKKSLVTTQSWHLKHILNGISQKKDDVTDIYHRYDDLKVSEVLN